MSSNYNMLDIAGSYVDLPNFEDYPNSVIKNSAYDVGVIQHTNVFETDLNEDRFNENIMYYNGAQLVASKYDSNGEFDQIMKSGENQTYDYVYPMYKESRKKTGEINSILMKMLIVVFSLMVLLILLKIMRHRMKRKTKAVAAMLLALVLVMNTTVIYTYADSNLYNEDGGINDTYFDENWVKISTVDDERIPLQSRSWTSQEIARVRGLLNAEIDDIRLMTFEEALLEKYIEEVWQTRADLRVDLKGNLIKSLVRLTISTGMTI